MPRFDPTTGSLRPWTSVALPGPPIPRLFVVPGLLCAGEPPMFRKSCAVASGAPQHIATASKMPAVPILFMEMITKSPSRKRDAIPPGRFLLV
jgi:hypothetical protein